METNGVAHKLRGHTRQIQSLRYVLNLWILYQSLREKRSWSRDSRHLLSSSQDWKCVLWDLKDGSKIRTVRFEAPVYIAELHPYNQYAPNILLAALLLTTTKLPFRSLSFRRSADAGRHIIHDTFQATIAFRTA